MNDKEATIIFNLIVMLFDDNTNDFKYMDCLEFAEYVCDGTGLTIEDFKKVTGYKVLT